MKKSFLILYCLAFLVTAAAHAEGQLVNQSAERAAIISKMIFARPEVVSVIEAAKSNKVFNCTTDCSKGEPTLTGAVNCDSHPTIFQMADSSLCEFNVTAKWGYKADPILSVTVKAYINRDKANAGKLTQADFAIESVNTGYPFPTGLW